MGVTMFRSPPGSEKPRRRIDADPGKWRTIRDDLHAVALEHGSAWIDLPQRTDVCPEMSGRDYELWQPLLALDAWLEDHGAGGLLQLLQEHALATIDAGQDDQAGDTEEILLRVLAEKRLAGDTPQARNLLDAAQETEPNAFRRWTAKGVGNALRRYGITTNLYGGRRVYGKVSLADLARIQVTYGLNLGIEEERTEGP